MIQMDGFDVMLNDRVFDMARGYGTVVEVRNDSFVVRFGNRLAAFSPAGVAARRSERTLYWHDPRVVVPAKNANDWDRQRQAIKVFTDYVASIGCNTAQVT